MAEKKVISDFEAQIRQLIADHRRLTALCKETAAERKAVFRSTAFPADKTLVRGSNLDRLVDEILGIIKN